VLIQAVLLLLLIEMQRETIGVQSWKIGLRMGRG